MSDWLSDLVSAIATQEGAFAGAKALPRRLNNPGNLIFAGQPGATPSSVAGADGKTRTFAMFSTWEQGVCALTRQVLKRVAEGKTLRSLITDPVTGWAPAADGNAAERYLAETVRRTGLQSDIPLIGLMSIRRIP